MVEKRGYVPSDLEAMGFDVNQYPFSLRSRRNHRHIGYEKMGQKM